MGNEASLMECVNPNCKEKFTIVVPAAEVINSRTISMVLWSHPDMQCCPNCGQAYQMQLRQIDGAQVVWGPIRLKSESSILEPPPGFRLPPSPH